MAITGQPDNYEQMMIRTASTWHKFFHTEALKPEYGTYDKFDGIPPSYLGEAEAFKEQMAANQLETIIIIPGPDKTVRLLHNCSVDVDKNKVNGIFGTKQFSPLKQAAIASLVKPFVTNTVTRTETTKLYMPSVQDFKECTSGADLLSLVGHSDKPIEELEQMPQSFWVHPHLLGAYITQRQEKIEMIGDSYAIAIEGMDDESATKLTEQYYKLLTFIWAVAKGHASSQIKLYDPPDDDATGLLLEKAQEKFRKATDGVPTPQEVDERITTGPEGETEDDHVSEFVTPRDRRDKSHSPRHDRSHSPRRNRSRIDRWRSRSRSPSWSRDRRNQRDRRRGRSRGRDRDRRPRSQDRSDHDRSRSGSHSSNDWVRRGNHGSRSRSDSRARSPGDRDILRQLTRGVSALAQVQNERMRKDTVEKSVLGKLSERQKDLFTLLAARDWYDTHPTLNKATSRLLSSRAPEKQWNLIEDWSRKWPGLVSKQGVVQFLASGYASRTLPGGFTVFMFAPLKHRKQADKKDRIRNIRGTFGKEGLLDDEAVEFYATLDYFVPTSISDAETQLEMAINLLEVLTHRQGIAIDGYLRGLDIIAKHRLQMYEEQAKDQLFMARFLHFLDLVFNNFCDDLAEYHTRSRPIEDARRRLRGRMKEDVDRVMRDIHHGITPNLPLPSILEGDTKSKPEKEGSSSPNKRKRTDDEDRKPPSWWITNPEVVEAWAIPDGKDMKTLFTSYSPQGKENLKRFPHVRHHNPEVMGKKPLCVKYQCRGKCRAGCAQAHLKPSSMTEDVKSKTAEAFRKAYA